MVAATSAVRTESITEKGTSRVRLNREQASALQALGFCRVSPTADPEIWHITDVRKVGVAGLGDVRIIVRPKTPLRSLIFMASYSGKQAEVLPATFEYDADQDVPVALAQALVHATQDATSRGLIKGYVTVDETGTVIRGRWDIARHLRVRPGIPVPVELTHDDYSEDVPENQILKAAVRALTRFEQLPARAASELGNLLPRFDGVRDLPPGIVPAVPVETRLNSRYQHALRISAWVLESVSWTHTGGEIPGSAFLLNVAKVYEDFLGRVLKHSLHPEGYNVDLQASGWTLDSARTIRMRPDILISRGGQTIAVADSKYKVWGQNDGSPPNADIYQGLAYAQVAGLPEVHLLYVSGEVEPRRYVIPSAARTVVAHALDVSGTPEELVDQVTALGRVLVSGSEADCLTEALRCRGRDTVPRAKTSSEQAS